MEQKFTNHLIHESSPYLLQHAHNPVDWHPWSTESLAKAINENKLIIISIGYAACHWCHVMEKESFEDIEVAQLMNEKFVSIKIDREERPDIDQVYMNAVQKLTGSGGWPLHCIALPDGRPVYGGTYFQKAQWMDILMKLADSVKENPEIAAERAKALTESLQSDHQLVANNGKHNYSLNDLNFIFNEWDKDIDYINGGHRHAPKFPLPVSHQYLLHYHYLTNNQNALNAVITTLNKMAEGGIYDQIGGGFARYSTDKYWKIPHFEKMLYDNAQIVSLYSTAYQLTKDNNYKTIVKETLEFIQRELTSAEGGFYSSIDADSEGEEGKFYVWSKAEFQEALDDKAELMIEYYNITENGNWENGKNILFKSESDDNFASKNNITTKELYKKINEAKKILFNKRSQRIRPVLDDKILTAWNALMLKAYTDAYSAFENPEYLKIALKNAAFIKSKLKSKDERLYRNYKNGNAAINAFLDDYAFYISALISLYQTDFDEKWIDEAYQLSQYTINHFYDYKTALFFYTSDLDTALICRNIETTDNVIPSANSEMAKNLYMLGHYLNNDEYIRISQNMLNNVKINALKYGAYYANWDILMAWIADKPFEVAIVGNEVESKRKEFESHYLPNVFLSGAKMQSKLALLENKFIENQTTIYVCRDKTCYQPSTEVKQALNQLKKQI
jgi:uncharacterized protein YyaL (SSP411 family)